MSDVVGYYVHHVGRGHLTRAVALATHLAASGGPSLTGLSSLPRPDGWPGDWRRLARDDDPPTTAVTAQGRLHWAPRGHAGLRARTAAVSAWIDEVAPVAVVVDVSVEMVLLVRLHGVAVVSVVQPGRRDDPAHLLAFDVADALVGFWPSQAHDMLRGVPFAVKDRVHRVGALSRVEVHGPRRVPAPGPGRDRRAVVLLGQGGHAALEAAPSGWSWTVLDGGPGRWVDDPSTVLREADVVVTHAGQNALAETAAARRPSVVVPQERPHEEQITTATQLRHGDWPAVVLDAWPATARAWNDVLDRAAALDGERWAGWCDGGAVARFADVIHAVIASSAVASAGGR